MNGKLKSLDRLKEIVEKLKRENKKVIFANGVFDVIHVGHVRYLKEAKALGDVLIVAINSDVSTKRIKGDGRPYNDESKRVEVLNAFECVDYIILFDEPDVRKLLSELKPDVQAKGTDYTEETVPERDIVLSYGGRVMITGDKKSHSSTEIIADLASDRNSE